MTAFNRLVVHAALVVGSAVTTASATEFDLPRLMASLSAVTRSDVDFEETRHLVMLAKPIVRRGSLSYVRPDHLAMRVTSPVDETIEIDGSRVSVRSPSEQRDFDLAQQPVALAWIVAIRASLAGDERSLERRFSVGLTGSAESWDLQLEPIDRQVAAALKRVDVHGSGAALNVIKIDTARGDRIVFTLSPAADRRP